MPNTWNAALSNNRERMNFVVWLVAFTHISRRSKRDSFGTKSCPRLGSRETLLARAIPLSSLRIGRAEYSSPIPPPPSLTHLDDSKAAWFSPNAMRGRSTEHTCICMPHRPQTGLNRIVHIPSLDSLRKKRKEESNRDNRIIYSVKRPGNLESRIGPA